MATIQEQLQRKRFPIDKWDIKEKFLLASAVVRSGDQNWMSVSRLMKTLGHPSRPADWYSQKNCAAQYGLLLENVETPKRKKRSAGGELSIETPSESILRRLKEERMIELKQLMMEERKLFKKLKEEINLVKSGRADEAQLREMCLQIEQENKQKEQDAQLHAEFLKQREEKKLELERQWRPVSKLYPTTGQKRKISDTTDSPLDSPKIELQTSEEILQETNKPAMSPLLTSLLKSPSPAPNTTSSILHSAITNNNQRGASPTIASLLNSSPEVNVSPGLQQLVSSAISQEPNAMQLGQSPVPTATIEPNLITANLVTGLNILTNQSDMKKDGSVLLAPDNIEEEMQLIEEVIKNVEENESKELMERREELSMHETDQSKIGEIKNELDKAVEPSRVVEVLSTIAQQIDRNMAPKKEESNEVVSMEVSEDVEQSVVDKPFTADSESKNQKIPNVTPPIREVSVVLEEIDTLQTNTEIKKENENIEQENEKELGTPASEIKIEDREETTSESTVTETTSQTSTSEEVSNNDEIKETTKTNKESNENVDEEIDTKIDIKEEPIESEIKTPEAKEETMDDIVKSTLTDESDFDESSTPLVKTEKVKRDYSRNKKKEDKDLDFFDVDKLELTNDDEKDLLEDLDIESDKKTDMKSKLKSGDQERSHSPWTEEETDVNNTRNKRRYSTPATPSDSVPNSPASSVTLGFEDDREYRAWKKSIMLIYNRMATHKYASLFLRPITDDQAPGYHSIIREPKDLQTLRRNIDNGQIKTTSEFIRYILLMFQNAIMYNKTNDYVYNMAREMQNECVEQIQIFVQAQTQIETPARRETRTSEPGLKHKADLSISKNRKRKLE